MVISVLNQKGGVSKSTSSVQIASFLATIGYRVLLVDMDGQKSATIQTLQKDDVTIGLFESLTNPRQDLPIHPLPNIQKNLFLVPSNKSLYGFDLAVVNSTRRENLLEKKLKPIKKEFDFIIIDCAPAKSLATQNALTASDYVLIPTLAEPSSYEGLYGLLETVELIKEDCNPNLKILGVFFAMFDGRLSISKSIKEAVIELFGEDMVFKTAIRQNVALKECQTVMQSIFDYAPNSNGATDYKNLTHEILNKLKNGK
jgi:chromosome partitioning protein